MTDELAIKLGEKFAKTPQWDKVKDGGELQLKLPNILYGGGVSFKKHLGKPLTEVLWQDLTMRLRTAWIHVVICHEDDGQVHAAILVDKPYDVEIFLDEDKNVLDIIYTPG